MSDKQMLLPSTAGWYGVTEVGSKVYVMDGCRPRLLERKPLLVGEWPPRSGEEPHGPLSAMPARVLCAILGITYETFLCLFNRINLLKHWMGDKRPRMSTLRVIASDLKLSGEPIVLLGHQVCRVMGFPLVNYQWDTLGQVPVVAIPDPSSSRKIGHASLHLYSSERQHVRDILERALLYHGKTFQIGDYPNGTGSMIQVHRGIVWGDAARRLKHKTKTAQR